MSLTPKAEAERKWGPFPALRTILETKRLPDHYYGFSTASDNVFDRLTRVLEISFLVRENAAAVSAAVDVEGDQRERLLKDLYDLREACQSAGRVFENAAEEIVRLQRL